MTSITVNQAIEALSVRIPFHKAAGWDVTGLHLGDPAASVERVAVCHEVTERVVAALENDPAGMLVTYHPPVFRPTNRIVAGRNPVGRAHRLIRLGVSVVVAHTAFDVMAGGTADALAQALGLDSVRVFGPTDPRDQVKVVTFCPAEHVDRLVDAMDAAGAGAIGNYRACHFRLEGEGGFDAGPGSSPVVGEPGRNREPETRVEMIAPAGSRDRVIAALVSSHPYEEPAFDVYPVSSNQGFIGRVGSWNGPADRLISTVIDRLGGQGLRASLEPDRHVSTVAVVPGSGSSFVAAAAGAGADVLITGDVGHHSVIEAADRGMGVIDPGHAPTERPGMKALYRTVSEALGASAQTIDLTDFDPTPWR